eukprot:5932810-Amphidinium_carterae.1
MDKNPSAFASTSGNARASNSSARSASSKSRTAGASAPGTAAPAAWAAAGGPVGRLTAPPTSPSVSTKITCTGGS